MTLPRITVRDRDSDDYPTFWVVGRQGDQERLLTAPLDADSFERAEVEAAEVVADPYHAVALVRFSHPAYNHPEMAQQYVVDLILEQASRELGVEYEVRP